MTDSGVVEAIALTEDQLGDSASSGESDEELVIAGTNVIENTNVLPNRAPIRSEQTVKVKEVLADEDAIINSPKIEATTTSISLKPIEGPKVDKSMLKVMGIDDEVEKVERDGHVPTIYDIDIDQLEDKPWRKADADITDWFNYGFTEETWREYCNAQVRMRLHLLGKKTPNKPKPVAAMKPKPEPKTLNLKPPQRHNLQQPTPAQSYMKPMKSNQPQSRPSQAMNPSFGYGNHVSAPPKPNFVQRAPPLPLVPPQNMPPPQHVQAPMPFKRQNPVSNLANLKQPIPNIQNLLKAQTGGDIQSLIPSLALVPGMPELTPSIAKLLGQGGPGSIANKLKKGSSSHHHRGRRSGDGSRDRSSDRDRGRRRRRRRRSRSRSPRDRSRDRRR